MKRREFLDVSLTPLTSLRFYAAHVANAPESKFERLYRRIAEDVHDGKPLIIITYAGLWPDGKQPENNIHWGTYHGPWRMFRQISKDARISRQYRTNWEELSLERDVYDPVRSAVFTAKCSSERWVKMGAPKEFDVYMVFHAFRNLRAGAVRMAEHLKHDAAQSISAGAKKLRLEDAQIVGYNGHNFYYDGPFYGLKHVKGSPKRQKGVFVIGCDTKPFFRDDLVDTNVTGVAFTTSFMAPEGYNILAMADGLSKAAPGPELARAMNESYRHWQMSTGNKRPGDLFVNDDYGLFRRGESA
ncbi:MAG: hypothetical protein HY514_01260 [Candidatus Aenigmarchaeota archaeon]|nr:hypothetical protein [Candidatus Aenigmarchaeota archaeon]